MLDTCVRVHVCVHVPTYYACACVCTYTCMHMRLCLGMRVCVREAKLLLMGWWNKRSTSNIFVRKYLTKMFLQTGTRIRVRLCVHVGTCAYVRTCAYVCMYVYECVCVCAYTRGKASWIRGKNNARDSQPKISAKNVGLTGR